MAELTLCEKCNRYISAGMWPFCPHPVTDQGAAIARDEIPGGITVENYGPQPITFYSHSERRAYMKAHGLREKEKFCPMPGTDIDPQGVPNPAGYLDPQTLENARILISRNGASQDPEWDGSSVLVGITTGDVTSRDVDAIMSGDKRRLSRFGRRTDGER